MGAVDTNVGSLLNEVLSITAQESREACPEILYGVHPQ